MVGLRERQSRIADHCERQPDAIVTYIDIKQFYPSIRPAVARYAWDLFSERSKLSAELRMLGEKLISNYGHETREESILTGPMFSHFLANLVLKAIDDNADKYPATYLRYVDDITLVGSKSEIDQSIDLISSDLHDLGLSLHREDPLKTLSVPVREWVKSSRDYQNDPDSTGWMRLVGDIRKLLIFKADQAHSLETALLQAGFRFPMPDYTAARQDRNLFEKVRRLGLWAWLFKRSRHVSVQQIVNDAIALRDQMEGQCDKLFDNLQSLSAFQRKRRISKLRYRLGRLAYLSSPRTLERLGNQASLTPDLALHSTLLRAIVTRDCSTVIELGSNVAQATAQIFRATGAPAHFSKPIVSEPEHQGLAILLLNGVSVEATVRSVQHPLVRFASQGVDLDLMTQPRGFVQEIACLHGLGTARHPETISTAFDLDQDISLDALEFDYGYYL
jgi:hypothetical protein